MRFPPSVAIWIFSLLIGSSALAQTTRSSPTDSFAPPLSRSISPAANLTEREAKSRFEGRGYSNIHGLHKDTFGIWHGTATRNGKTFKLSLDVDGNVGIE
jgi:putative membrane protein